MKTFIANVAEIYVWDCPYCGDVCKDLGDPNEEESIKCEHCGEEAFCEGTER